MEQAGGAVARAPWSTVSALVIAMRPHQWGKNLFVLAPLFFARSATEPGPLLRSLATFAAFCAASSAVYLANDVRDRAHDRLHPDKRHRPLAAGTLSPSTAVCAALFLALGAWAVAAALDPYVATALGAYLVHGVCYSVWLKRQVILDVLGVAAGFVLRVIAGGEAVGAAVSEWLLLCTTLLALFLGFSKRRHELLILGPAAPAHRAVLAEYGPRFLDMMIGIVTACTLMCYALYTMSPETVAKFGTTRLLWTAPFVLYGIFRYLYLVYQRNEGGDPTQNLLSDRPTVVNFCLWVLAVALVLYGG